MPLWAQDPILHLQQQDYHNLTITQLRNISSMQNMYFDTLKAQESSRSNTMEALMPGESDTQTQIGVKIEMIITQHQDMFS